MTGQVDEAGRGRDGLLRRAETAEAEVVGLRTQLADYENRITWDTTCGQCAATLDASIREYERAEALAGQVAAIRALCQDANGYTTWDQIEKLGEPPWRGADPNLVAWEQAHGHDVRLGCDNDCLLLIDPEDVRAALVASSPTSPEARNGA